VIAKTFEVSAAATSGSTKDLVSQLKALVTNKTDAIEIAPKVGLSLSTMENKIYQKRLYPPLLIKERVELNELIKFLTHSMGTMPAS